VRSAACGIRHEASFRRSVADMLLFLPCSLSQIGNEMAPGKWLQRLLTVMFEAMHASGREDGPPSIKVMCKMCNMFHLQDKNPNNRQKAEEQFKIVSEAYDVSHGAVVASADGKLCLLPCAMARPSPEAPDCRLPDTTACLIHLRPSLCRRCQTLRSGRSMISLARRG
jgi:hypothetical protein